MALRRAIIIASFGDRDAYIASIIKNVRAFWNGPLHLITDRTRTIDGKMPDCWQKVLHRDELLWRDHPRWGVRNCNLELAKVAIWEGCDSVCCLNDDMRIVHKGFIDGFALAEKFGVCVPMNPRIYVKYNAMGTDATDEDRKEVDKGPIYGPACNMSPMFVCRLHDHARRLIEAYIEELQNCMRGTLAFWLASWRTGITPLYLPEQWCVCQSSAEHIRDYKKTLQGRTYSIEPMMLHWGQEGVRKVFKEIEQ